MTDPASPVPAASKTQASYTIALQAICDRHYRHVADELLYRAQHNADHADIADPLQATARACSAALYEVGLSALVGSRSLFFNTSEEWINNPEIMPLSSEQLVAEVPCHLLHQADACKKLQHLRHNGYRIALDDFSLETHTLSALNLVDYLKIDIRTPHALRYLQTYKDAGVLLVACFVESIEQLQQAREAGFDLFQGYVFAPPAQIRTLGVKRHSNREAQLRILSELCLAQPALERLETLLAQDPHLCTLLLKYINSAANQRRARTITQLRDAILMAGFDRIKALASAILLSRNDPIHQVRLRTVLIRAAMCKNLAQRISTLDKDSAFIVGLFSNLEGLEDTPLNELLKAMPLSEAIKDALLHREGELGKLLQLVEDYEAGHLLQKSPPFIALLNQDYLQASAWTENLLTAHGMT